MNDTIYSAEFAKQLCDEYNSIQSQLNRAIKEAVSYGNYYTSFVLTNAFSDYDRIVECINKFENLGYNVTIQNENLFDRDSVRIIISWN